jgi:hypothetical protein
MKKTLTLFALAAVVGCNSSTENKSTTTTTTDSTATAAKPAETAPPPPMDSAAMAKAMMEYGTPGDMHKWMASMSGKWDADVTSWWNGPDKPAQTSKAVGESKMIMGGRYQQSSFKGNMGGMPFEGMELMGYDNSKKMFQDTWIDNMGTGFMNLEGTMDQATHTITMKGKSTDPTTGKDQDVREVMTMPDEKHQTLEMYMTPAGGKEMKVMEIKYTKK